MPKDRAILHLALGQTLVWAGLYYIFPASLLRWEQELGWSKTSLTAAITLAVLISAMLSPLTGRIIDKGRGPLMMAGSAFCGGIGLLFLSMVTELWQFYLVWAAIGMTMAGCLYEPCFALITRTRGEKAKSGIIFITLAAGFASTISFPVMHTLASQLGWRTATVMFGLMVILFVTPLLWSGARGLEQGRMDSTKNEEHETGKKDGFLKRPTFWFLAIGFASIALVHGATLHHLLPILDERGISGEMAVLAASFIGPMQVAGRLAMMASEKYTSHHGIAVVAFVLIGLSIVLLAVSGASPAFLSSFVILFAGAYGTVSILRPLITRDILGQRNFGAKSGALALPYLGGSATAPYLGSLIWERGGYDVMLIILTILTVIGCCSYLVAHRLSGS
ncbi:MFS transporter [Pseudohalocynthiibacter aestuariivivens]|uniref:MFS transporter n=1 Tax=Pseudohalocynthiibacter aestuariivivens TaxID=1591409 RepID=A0ABV5JGK6_9RHOB|nr:MULTISPECIES: MFS transporter [Pseudohalocynthiibacter]MBS9718957.1 MFS transporter [Pseudohalocynthiibacter aestuariivivens]MCK0103555.1 MFS transporter [Pseudohalocynthiibacter sp. F2068]